jgi:short-subunit dehydrogenase
VSAPQSDAVHRSRLRHYGEWAIVTGASEGIGRAMSAELAAHGLHLLLVARREERLRALADELSQHHGIEARVLALDLGQAGALDSLKAAIAGLDVGLLVAAAGYGSTGPLTSSDLAQELD